MDVCATHPPDLAVAPDHLARCWLLSGDAAAASAGGSAGAGAGAGAGAESTLPQRRRPGQ